MTRKYFGTDGIRGKVGKAPITPDFVMRLGYAAGQVLAKVKHQESNRPTVLIGKDTRISGYMLEAALQAGFAAAGVDVVLAGPVPTPAIAYLTRALRLNAGVVISASHNPFDDNGIKFFSAQGTKLPDDVELEIEAGLEREMGCVPSEKLGKARRLEDAQGRYIEFCKSSFPNELDLRGLKIVVDCAHGAAYHIAPHVLHELGAEVIAIGNQPNGLNINDKVGATDTAALAQAVVHHHADLGIALTLLSSYFQKPVPAQTIALGEVSLTGLIKPIQNIDIHAKEAAKFGFDNLLIAHDQKLETKTNKHVRRFKSVYDLLELFPE